MGRKRPERKNAKLIKAILLSLKLLELGDCHIVIITISPSFFCYSIYIIPL